MKLPATESMLDSFIGHFSGGSMSVDQLAPKAVRELQERLDAGKYFGQDMTRLWRTLEQTFARTGGAPRNRAGEDFRLLNLACGHCEEAAVLSAFFARPSANVRQYALDLRDSEIAKAKRRYAATEDLFRQAGLPLVRSRERAGIEFIADDATRLVKYGQIPSAFEVIFMRHQNLWNDRKIWRRIFEFALDRLAPPGGILVITSYFDREHLLALELLRELGGSIVTTARNPDSRELDHPGKSVDRHVAAIRRREVGGSGGIGTFAKSLTAFS